MSIYGVLSEGESRRVHFEMTQKTQLAHDVSAAAVFTLPPSSNAYLADVGSGLQTVYDPPDDLTLTMTRSLVQTDSPREVRPFEPLLCMSCVCVCISNVNCFGNNFTPPYPYCKSLIGLRLCQT